MTTVDRSQRPTSAMLDEYLIRPFAANDADSLAKHANNRNVWLNLRDAFPHPYSLQDAKWWIDHASTLPQGSTLAICTMDECIGGIGVKLGEDIHRKSAELGYWLGEQYWGRGVISQAVPLFVDYVVRRFELVRVFAIPFERNAASCRVLEKSGFQLEGRMAKHASKDGQLLDCLLYAKVVTQSES